MQVSYFQNGISQINPTKTVTIQEVLDWIKNGEFQKQIENVRKEDTKKERDKLKNGLPYFTSSGTFSKRNESGLLSHSGLIQIDFDKVENLVEVKNKLISDPYILACFLSPTATGLKAVVKIEPDASKHKDNFTGLENYFLTVYGLVIDKSCKDVSRAMFVSYDPNLYFNPNAEIWVTPISKPNPPQPENTNYTFQEIFDFCVSCQKDSFYNGNRNQYVSKLAYMCNEFGLSEQDVKDECVSRFQDKDFTPDEIVSFVNSCYRNRQDKHATKPYEPEKYRKPTNEKPPNSFQAEPETEFDDLKNPHTLINHFEGLMKKNEVTAPHAEILQQLIKQFEPLDFEVLAFPQAEELRKQLKQLENKLTKPDGSINTDKAFDREQEDLKDLKRELSKLKLSPKHYLILSIENALKLAEKNSWGLCKNHDFIYLYNGTFWAEIDSETFQKFLGESAEKMGVAKFSARFYQFREQLFKQFLATAYLPTPESNKDTVLINLINGTFEISPKGTHLRPFDRSDFITYQLPFEYEPQAKAPLFEKYLNRVLPDKERQRVLAEYLGFVFIKHGSNALKEEKALILYGTGANGKSVFFEVVNALLGTENVGSYSLQSLTNENGYFRAKLANKLVNYASEINGNLEASIFKQLVSGEPVEARLPYGQPFILKQYAKLIFNCNELPKDVEHTNAYFRRFLIIPFDVTIPTHEQDKNLHNKIIEKELSGVFNWVLEGLNRLLEQKSFSSCEAAQRAVEQYRIESDSVQMFLSEHCYKVSATNEIPLKDMFNEYRNYCIESGFKACSVKTLADRLRNAGYQTERKNYGTGVNAEKKLFF